MVIITGVTFSHKRHPVYQDVVAACSELTKKLLKEKLTAAVIIIDVACFS